MLIQIKCKFIFFFFQILRIQEALDFLLTTYDQCNQPFILNYFFSYFHNEIFIYLFF